MRPTALAALVFMAACGAPAAETGSGSGTTGAGSSGTGSTGSSSSGSGSSGSSGTTGALPLTDTFDPQQVYVVGTFDEQYCGSDAIFAPSAPTDVLLGLPCWDAAFKLAPDGKLYYLLTAPDGTNSLRLFASDALIRADGGWAYPPATEANDAAVPTPLCDSQGGPTAFQIDPDDGGTVFSCAASFNWYDASGTLRVSNAPILTLAPGGHALVYAGGQLQVRDAAGTPSAVSGIHLDGFTQVNAVRSDAAGFWVVIVVSDGRTLYRVDFSGASTQAGTYPNFGTTSSVAVLDGAGNLVTFGQDPLDATADTLVELPLGGSSPVQLYTERGAPPPDWSSTPPVLHPKLSGQGGRLFSGR